MTFGASRLGHADTSRYFTEVRIKKSHVNFRSNVIYQYKTIATRIRGLFTPFASQLGIGLSPLPGCAFRNP